MCKAIMRITKVYICKYTYILVTYSIFLPLLNKISKRRGGDLNSCGADAPRAFQARAVPV